MDTLEANNGLQTPDAVDKKIPFWAKYVAFVNRYYKASS